MCACVCVCVCVCARGCVYVRVLVCVSAWAWTPQSLDVEECLVLTADTTNDMTVAVLDGLLIMKMARLYVDFVHSSACNRH